MAEAAIAMSEAAALVSAEELPPEEPDEEEFGVPPEEDDDDGSPDFAICFSSALAYLSASLFSYCAFRPSTFCFARYARYAQLPIPSKPTNIKSPSTATITFNIPLPDFCGAVVLDVGTVAETGAVPAVLLPAPAPAACTAIPHFAQNFVPTANGLPHPTQNFCSGGAAASDFVPHEEQNACASASDAP